MKTWKEMSDKERNDYLGSIGGCGSCTNWRDYKNPLTGLVGGCALRYIRDRSISFQSYDNGCLYYTSRNEYFFDTAERLEYIKELCSKNIIRE